METNNESKLLANISSDVVDAQINEETSEPKHAKQFVVDLTKYFNTQLEDGEEEKKLTIRILPLNAMDTRLYAKIGVHSVKLSKRIAQSGFKTFSCLNDPSTPNHDPKVRCPLCEKSAFYYAEADRFAKQAAITEDVAEKEHLENEVKKYKLLGANFRARDMYVVRIIDRDKEEDGPKFWRFKKKNGEKDVLSQLLSLYNDRKQEYLEDRGEDYNIFDLENGKDLILTLKRVPSPVPGRRDSVAVTINDKSISTPLSKDTDLANKWIGDSVIWQDIYTIRDAEYLSLIAEGLIPWKDKQTGHYVGYKESDFDESGNLRPRTTEEPPTESGESIFDLDNF